jgi:nucleotide-binding universal stress UspA family protein
MKPSLFAAATLAALLSACATAPQQTTPVVTPSVPSMPPTPITTPTGPVVSQPVSPPAPVPPFPAYPNEAAARALVQNKLLPTSVRDKAGWSQEIVGAFTGLHLPYRADLLCAAMAVIEQESTWQADPVVPGLGEMVWKKIAEKAGGVIPVAALKVAFLKPSATGESYTSRIDRLRTEKEMNALFEDMVADARRLGLPVNMKNPIRTGGPMQVSVEFAEEHVRAKGYPYPHKGSWRDEVFSRRGGLYFGIANLLDFPADYPDMRYRFADFNAGRYSSRNAAFQAAVSRLSGMKLSLDGDLLIYRDGAPSSSTSSTQLALERLEGRLGMSRAEVSRDLRLEKTPAFSQSALYQKVFALAGGHAARAVMPQIQLVSPKITRKLTTEWFADRVDGRYKACLAREAR